MYGYLYLRQANDGTLLARLREPESSDLIGGRDWPLEQVGRTDTAMRALVDAWLAEIGWVIEPGQLDLLADNEPVLASKPDTR